MQRLRIAMVSAHSCPSRNPGGRDTGGMNVYITEVARALAKRGHLVDVFTRAHEGDHEELVRLGRNIRLIHLEPGRAGDIHKLLIYSTLADFACAAERSRRDRRRRYDILHSHYWLSGWAGERLKSWWRIPHVTMFHTLGLVKNQLSVGEEEPELRTETERELALNCNRIIAATESEKGFLEQYYGASPDRVEVVPCGVDLSRFRPLDKAGTRRRLGLDGGNLALFVGRIEPLKGLERLLEAMGSLRKHRDIRLLAVGEDEDGNSEAGRIASLVKELHLEDAVRFRGLVRHDDLPDYYNAADVCVVPSHYESFGLVALESLACGTPVATTRVGSMEAIIDGRNGVVVDGSPDGIAAGVGRLLDTPVSAHEVRSSVATYTWARVAEALETVYLDLVRP